MTSIKYVSHQIVVLLFVFMSLVFLNTCKEEKLSEPEPTSAATEFYETVVKTQEQKAELFEELVSSIDTLAAMDSVLKIFLQDTLVDWGETSRQGIAIQYKNGIRGGIFIDPLDYPNSDDLLFDPNLNKIVTSFSFDNIQNTIPTSKQTIFLNPSYWERKKYADQLIDNYQTRLKNVGFSNPIVYKNEEVTVDKFNSLNNYGIIHVYSHGWAWPKMNNIKKVFLLLGERYSHETANKYFAELLTGDLIAVYYKKINATVFLISPEFINNLNNDFTSTSPLFYGGFCFSNLGNWPNVIVNWLGAGGYFGFSWFVRTSANAKWNEKIIETLSDTSNGQVRTTNDWITNQFPKQYWCNKAEKYIKIQYTGESDLALKEKEEEEPFEIVNGNYSCYVSKRLTFDLREEISGTDGSLETREYSETFSSTNTVSGVVSGGIFTGVHDDDTTIVTFSNDFRNINYSLFSHYWSGLNNENTTYRIDAINIPLYSNTPSYQIKGPDLANYISYADYTSTEFWMDGEIRYTKAVTTTNIKYDNSSKIFIVVGKIP